MIPIRKPSSSQSLLLLLVFLLAHTNSAQAGWGAAKPDLADRPDLGWLTRFAAKADVVATEDISLAINMCDAKVGANNYCSVELRTTEADPFTISRSKTRIFSLSSKRTESTGSVRAVPGETTISIGSNTEKVVIENLQLVGVYAGHRHVYAISVSGNNINDVVIRRNRVLRYDSNSSAHGIVILGDGSSINERISNITIDMNNIYDMRTGSSESIAINGNVSNWVISNNRIERVNNIAIDAIGGEGIVAPVKVAGRVLPNPLDAARYGWIEDNIVNNMSTLDNPAYGRKHSWAGAIYVDGGRDIAVTGNKVNGAPWAYDIGAENCVIAENITLTNNTATNSHFGDLRLGGYAETGYMTDPTINCDPHSSVDANEGHGFVRRVTVTGNRFQSIGTVLPGILVEYRTTESIIAEPGIDHEPGIGNGAAVGDGNAYLTTE